MRIVVLMLVTGTLLAATAGAADARMACPRQNLDDPYRVAAQFLTTAVERRNLADSYRLATPSLRGSLSCADWAAGRLPVRAFLNIDWSRSAYEPVAGGDGQVVIRVLLYRPNQPLPVPFLMEIQREPTEPGWHVGYFAPDRWYKPKPISRLAA
jgi:hypothetical protein